MYTPFPAGAQTIAKSQPWPSQRLEWTSDMQSLAKFIGDLRWNMATPQVLEIVDQMFALNPEQSFRRVLVEFRDAKLEATPYHFGQELEAQQMKEITGYQRLGITVYTFVLQDDLARSSRPASLLTMPANAYSGGSTKIERIAIATGGRFFSDADYKSKVPEIQKDLQSQFAVTFVPQATKGDEAHSLELRTGQKDLRLASQNHYYAQANKNP
jgi:hypothetical protein